MGDFAKTIEAIYLLVAQEGLEKAKIERGVAIAVADLQQKNLEATYQEYRRPWRAVGAVVGFDAEKNQWKCEFQGVTAWGDTPEIACDNFDHLWMFG
jgi:hypothetical protein